MIQVRGSKYRKQHYAFLYKVLRDGFLQNCPNPPKHGAVYCCDCYHHQICKDIYACKDFLEEQMNHRRFTK